MQGEIGPFRLDGPGNRRILSLGTSILSQIELAENSPLRPATANPVRRHSNAAPWHRALAKPVPPPEKRRSSDLRGRMMDLLP